MICPPALAFSINTDISVGKVHFSSNLKVGGRYMFRFHLLFVNSDSVCFGLGSSSLFLRKSLKQWCSVQVCSFSIRKYTGKNTFSNQPSFLLLHLDGYYLLTFVQAPLYNHDNSDFHLPSFSFSCPSSHFSCITQYIIQGPCTQWWGLCLVMLFYFIIYFLLFF